MEYGVEIPYDIARLLHIVSGVYNVFPKFGSLVLLIETINKCNEEILVG